MEWLSCDNKIITIIVSTNVLAYKSTGASAGAMMTEKLNMIFAMILANVA